MTRRPPRTRATPCGWCLDGLHVASEKTRGCVQAQANPLPCPCPDPSHKETRTT